MKRHYGDRLDKILLFGSYARGDFQEESDVDDDDINHLIGLPENFLVFVKERYA